MHAFKTRIFEVGVSTNLKLNAPPSSRNMLLICLFRNPLPLSVRTHSWWRRLFEYLGSLNMERNAEATEGPLLSL